MSYEKMLPFAINRGKLGWAVQWPCGFQSAMPSREIALRSAASGEMYQALSAALPLVNLVDDYKPLSKSLAHAILRANGEA